MCIYYAETKEWLENMYKERGIENSAYEKFIKYEQRTQTFKSYYIQLTHLKNECSDKGVPISAHQFRYTLLGNMRQELVKKARKHTQYHTITVEEFIPQLEAWDESIRSETKDRHVSIAEVEEIKNKQSQMEKTLAAAVAEDGTLAYGGGGVKKKTLTTKKYRASTFQDRYSEEEWRLRVQCQKERSDPRKIKHCYDKDTIKDKGKTIKVCTFCQKTGHNLPTCRELLKVLKNK